jgi:hypothetical protein
MDVSALSDNSLIEWLTQFAAVHRRAKAGELSPEEKAAYVRLRDELAEAMLTAQRLNLKPGEMMRRSLRVAQALSVELELPEGRVSALTLDLSTGGFSALVSTAPEPGSPVGFTLKLGRALEPVKGRGKVVAAVPHKGSVRLGIMFEVVAAADRDRLEFIIVDAILRQFGVR